MKFRSQNGFSIIGAIFIIVVVALIAAFLVGIGASQRTSSAHAVVALRAHFAAMSGVEWAVHQVLANPASPACFANGTSFTVPGVGSGNFRVTGVFEEVPANSHLQFDFLASFITLRQIDGGWMFNNWYWPPMYTYAKVPPTMNVEGIEAKFPEMVTKYLGELVAEQRGYS